ncbi:Tensin-3 [Nymphon striatum]|nr:Tensin-3 [Nymphon striatum]
MSRRRSNSPTKQVHRPEPLVTKYITSGWTSETSQSPYSADEKNTPPSFSNLSRSNTIDGSNIRPPKSPSSLRKDRSPSPATVQALKLELSNGPQTPTPSFTTNGQSSPTVYFGQSRRSSLASELSEVIQGCPGVVRDISRFWYKPNISREDAISVLKEKPAGTFVVRDSNSFPGAFGLALKVSTPPPNVQNKTGDMSNELVRHFLIEPTKNGVKLKGCSNEPVFGSLSALVHQHTITPLALPCRLILPEPEDTVRTSDVLDNSTQEVQSSPSALLTQGAACNVLHLGSVDMESLSGPQAVRKAMTILMLKRPLPDPTVVHFKVSSQGITLTDNSRKKFFRRHYPVTSISHCSMDPDDRRWNTKTTETELPMNSNRCFGFIAKINPGSTDNRCHLFAELEPEQPASAIVNFVTKVMMAETTEQERAQLL